uniref:ER membrane protein complex subunit 10 n=1 Tax=Ascaris lumbricoides TaxID=6252 RepID=A0A0M3I714_ASCLU
MTDEYLRTSRRKPKERSAPVALYGSERWTAILRPEQALHQMERRVSCSYLGITSHDHIVDDNIRHYLGFAPITREMQEARLRCFGHMLLRWILSIVGTLSVVTCDWRIPLEYSLSDNDVFTTLGTISVERSFDGNYTARFISSADINELIKQMHHAITERYLYRVRIKDDSGHIQGYNHPCLMLRANLAHQFRISLDTDRQLVHSLAVFPENLFVAGPDYERCVTHEIRSNATLRGSVALNTVGELPIPDTMSYIQKMEKERLARQHGAQQDNRSFLQKYWMYIAAGFIFILISNAAAGEQNAE